MEASRGNFGAIRTPRKTRESSVASEQHVFILETSSIRDTERKHRSSGRGVLWPGNQSLNIATRDWLPGRMFMVNRRLSEQRRVQAVAGKRVRIAVLLPLEVSEDHIVSVAT